MMAHRSLNQNILLATPALVLLAAVAAIEMLVIRQTGRVVYPIDDPYIHMAMARHFAEYGVFGVSLAGFSATSSSPFWTLLLGATFRIVGSHECIPLLWNVLFGTAVAFYLTRLLAEGLQSARAAAIAGILLVFILPLPTLVTLGMEHTLHILLILLLVKRTADSVDEEKPSHSAGVVILLTFLSILVRFETVFVAVPLAWFALVRRRWMIALALLGGCSIPLLVLGWINLHNGWFFFPTSVMLKSALSQHGWERLQTLIERLYGQLFGAPHMAVTFVLGTTALFAAWRRETVLSRHSIWIAVFTAATILHCSLASIGWFYRYEGYLLALGAAALAPFARDSARALWDRLRGVREWGERWTMAAGLAGIVLLLPFPYYDHYQSIAKLVPAARNIYSQQYQMGLFLRQYYPGEAVAANDIGAINFLADIVCLDVMGLGSTEPVRAKLQGFWSDRFLHSWCTQHRVAIAAVYENWLRKALPPVWIKAGEWTVEEKVSVADTTVTFFAPDPQQAERLRKNLKAFEPQLPPGVRSVIYE